jgi:hypothetical protein
MKSHVVPNQTIETRIFIIRGHKVMLDEDLAGLYRVEVRILVRNVKRNMGRFPPDFMFQLSREETVFLRSQIGISSSGYGGRRYLPYAFIEQGIAMLSSVLNSQRAIRVNIQIMRTFIRLKQMINDNSDLRKKIASLERKYDKKFSVVFEAINKLLDGPEKRFRVKGFGLVTLDRPKQSLRSQIGILNKGR